MTKQALIIVNKKSGTSDKKNIAHQINRWIDKEAFNYKIVFTEYKGHAVELSQQASKAGIDLVVAVGGDGSVNEVARGIIHTDTALGIIPMGSGNGLARSLEIPISLSKAIRILNKFQLKDLDVGIANKQLFLSNTGVGFDALVAKEFEQSTKRGLLSYAQIIIRTLFRHHPQDYTLYIDGKRQDKKAFFISVANGNQLGYNFKIIPHASPFDGFLDIAVIKDMPFWWLPIAAVRSINGSLLKSSLVEYIRCKELTIKSEEDIGWIQTDGDAIAVREKEIKIKLLPKALKVVVP